MMKYKIIIGLLLIILLASLGVGFYYNHQLSPISRDSEKVVVEIKEGSIASIGETLEAAGLIRSNFIFKIYVKLNNVKSLKATTYELNKNMK